MKRGMRPATPGLPQGGPGVRVLALALLAGCGGPPPTRITGAFVSGLGERQSAAWWDREVATMKAAGLDTVILQHATYGDPGQALWTPNDLGLPAPSGNLVGDLLGAAERAGGLAVIVGLGYRTNWNFTGGHTQAQYRDLAAFNVRVAEDLWRRFGRSSAFAGWYLPQEPDSQRSWEPVSAAPGTPLGRLLRGYYLPVMARLKELAPGRPIVISPFFGWNAMPPIVFRKWYTLLLNSCPVDILAMQDGIGVFHASLGPPGPGEAPCGDALVYLAAMRDACRVAGKSFWLDLEAFREKEDGDLIAATPEALRLGTRRYPGLGDQLRREAPVIRANGPWGNKILAYEWSYLRSTKNQGSR